MADETFTAPPSDDGIGEAAHQIDAACPAMYAHQRAGIAFLLFRRLGLAPRRL